MLDAEDTVRSVLMTQRDSVCPDCGAPFAGRAECDSAFHTLGARAYADAKFAYRRRAAVDAYCLQHPAYIESIKSLAAHLCGLCAAMERPSDARADHAIWRGLRVPPNATKPHFTPSQTTTTIAAVCSANTPDEFREAVDRWIGEVWAAWGPCHGIAREWLDYAVAHPALPRRDRAVE